MPDSCIISKNCMVHPQALSYYKIFGYPTGLGALLVRRDVLPLLRKSYFGGGTVAVSLADERFYRWVRCMFLCRHAGR